MHNATTLQQLQIAMAFRSKVDKRDESKSREGAQN
jgi:hypothetical protein